MYLLESVASRFTTAALTYFLAEIDQHLVLPLVLNCSCDAPRYMSGGPALSLFSLNTYLIPSVVFTGTHIINITLPT